MNYSVEELKYAINVVEREVKSNRTLSLTEPDERSRKTFEQRAKQYETRLLELKNNLSALEFLGVRATAGF
jgi:hypothetical protein